MRAVEFFEEKVQKTVSYFYSQIFEFLTVAGQKICFLSLGKFLPQSQLFLVHKVIIENFLIFVLFFHHFSKTLVV